MSAKNCEKRGNNASQNAAAGGAMYPNMKSFQLGSSLEDSSLSLKKGQQKESDGGQAGGN